MPQHPNNPDHQAAFRQRKKDAGQVLVTSWVENETRAKLARLAARGRVSVDALIAAVLRKVKE